jgi:hypothetical protein
MAQTKGKSRNNDDEREIDWALIVRMNWMMDRSKLLTCPSAIPETCSDALFAELVKLARVQADDGDILRKNISYEVSKQWGPAKRKPAKRTSVVSKSRALLQLKRCVKLLQQLNASLSNLDQQALDAILQSELIRSVRLEVKAEHFVKLVQELNASASNLDQQAPTYSPVESHRFFLLQTKRMAEWNPAIFLREDSLWPGDLFTSRWLNFRNSIDGLTELSSEALSLLREKPAPNPPGRPRRGPFSTYSSTLAEFTLRLLLNVRAAGGRLTLDKNNRSGTLVKALDLLRPHVPPQLIPMEPPVSILTRVKALDKKIATVPEPLERFLS